MPTRDTHHNAFVRALAKDGWTVTHDPLRLLWRKKVFFVDVGAERVIAAERGREQIAIEMKLKHFRAQMQSMMFIKPPVSIFFIVPFYRDYRQKEKSIWQYQFVPFMRCLMKAR